MKIPIYFVYLQVVMAELPILESNYVLDDVKGRYIVHVGFVLNPPIDRSIFPPELNHIMDHHIPMIKICHMFHNLKSQSDMNTWFLMRSGKEIIGFTKKIYYMDSKKMKCIVLLVNIDGEPYYMIIACNSNIPPHHLKGLCHTMSSIDIDRKTLEFIAYAYVK